MENASKALIMAATVLLGVMIISVGVTLYKTFSSFSAETAKQMQDKQTAEWNNNYLKYYGSQTYYDSSKNKDVTEPIRVTAHDIITIINNARQNNIIYSFSYITYFCFCTFIIFCFISICIVTN